MDYSKPSAIVFLDYNDTFDDVCDSKGHVFIEAAKRFINYFQGNVQFVVVTAAPASPDYRSIKNNLSTTLNYLPFRSKFNFLIEDSNKIFNFISSEDNTISYGVFLKNNTTGTKADGVQELLHIIDPFKEISTIVFAGDSKEDLVMYNADVGERNKFFIYNGKKSLNSVSPVYSVNNPNYSQTKDMFNAFNGSNQGYIKTSTSSYGIAKGLDKIVSYLRYLESSNNYQHE